MWCFFPGCLVAVPNPSTASERPATCVHPSRLNYHLWKLWACAPLFEFGFELPSPWQTGVSPVISACCLFVAFAFSGVHRRMSHTFPSVGALRKVIRFIQNLPLTSYTAPYFVKNRILALHQMFPYRLVQITFEDIKQDPVTFYTTHPSVPDYNLRQKHIRTERVRINYGHQKLLDQIPELIRKHYNIIELAEKTSSIHKVKADVKSYLLSPS